MSRNLYIHENNFELSQSDLARMVFVGIDLQQKYCRTIDPIYNIVDVNGRTAQRVSEIAGSFNTWGLDAAWIYFADKAPYQSWFPWLSYSESSPFHTVTPHASDILIPKVHNSAFESFSHRTNDIFLGGMTPIEAYLTAAKKDILVVAGVNRTACVLETVAHALKKGYHVIMLRDMVSNRWDHADDEHDDRDEYSRFHGIVSRNVEISDLEHRSKGVECPQTISPDCPLPARDTEQAGRLTIMHSSLFRREMEKLHLERISRSRLPVASVIQPRPCIDKS